MGIAGRVAAPRVRRIVWSRAAREDVRRIRDYIKQFNSPAANRVAAALLEAADSLAQLPERGRQIRAGRRELVAVAAGRGAQTRRGPPGAGGGGAFRLSLRGG